MIMELSTVLDAPPTSTIACETRLIIVVPCYNEATRLDVGAFREFAHAHPHIHFLFVNDGSRDGTAEVIDNLADADPQSMECLHLPKNQGKGEAVRQGMLHAMKQPTEYIGFWDADLSTPLDELEKFCAILDENNKLECAIGSRLRMCGHVIERSFSREILSRCFARAASLVLGVRLRDTQCGAKIFRNSPTLRHAIGRPFIAAWTFDVELLARYLTSLSGNGRPEPRHAIYEYPLPVWIDRLGSKRKLLDLARALRELTLVGLCYRLRLRNWRS